MGDLIQAFQNYIWKIVGLSTIEGMKALLLDDEVTKMVGIACSLTDVINKEVYLVEKLQPPAIAASIRSAEGGAKNAVGHLKAICIVRPTRASVEALCAEISRPRFKEYHVFFTGITSQEHLRAVAAADAEYELVRQVQEYYADYHPVTSSLFTANVYHTTSLYHGHSYWRPVDRERWARNLDALSSVLLALKRRPTVRCAQSSELAKRLGGELTRRMRESEGLFSSAAGAKDDTLLLIVDRKDDPVTPLLQCWLYQSMVHEKLGIFENRVDMRGVPKIIPDLREIVLSPHQDTFFASSMYLNFGEMGGAVKNLVSQYQAKMKTTARVESLEDMQNFVDKYPEFRAMSGNVSKHVAILGELSRQVNLDDLMALSQIEQDLACANAHTQASTSVWKVIEDPAVRFDHKLRLVMLYALRYEHEKRNHTERMILHLRTTAARDERSRVRSRAVEEVLRVAGARARGGDLFSNKSVWARVGSMLESSVKGVDNVFTRHKPLVSETVDLLAKGKLRTRDFPLAEGAGGTDAGDFVPRPSHVIIYFIGGTTFEESAAMHVVNTGREHGGLKVTLGGSCVHNTKTYIDDLLQDEGNGSVPAVGVTTVSAVEGTDAADGGSVSLNLM